MPPTLDSPALDYAPGAPIRRRRRIRLAVALFLVIATPVAAYLWGPALWSRVALLYRQRSCLRYTAPADQVVFDSDPARVAQLAGDANYVISGGCAFRKPLPDWVPIHSAALRALRAGAKPAAMIFLHELRVGGITRLVEVERTAGSNESPYFITGYDVATHSITPATFRQPHVAEQQFFTDLDVLDSVGPHLDIRIYAGQPDPADPSHFTIRYEHAGQTHMIHGYLCPDGSIELTRTPHPMPK